MNTQQKGKILLSSRALVSENLCSKLFFMKIRILRFFLFAILFIGCKDSKQKNTEEKVNLSQNDLETDKQNIDLKAPDLTDPTLKKYYNDYTAYIKKTVTTIRNKDDAGAMKLFKEEGNQFDNSSAMEQKARATPGEEQKFTTWFMQSVPLLQEIVRSDYYKKFNEEYYKKIQEKVKEMDKK